MTRVGSKSPWFHLGSFTCQHKHNHSSHHLKISWLCLPEHSKREFLFWLTQIYTPCWLNTLDTIYQIRNLSDKITEGIIKKAGKINCISEALWSKLGNHTDQVFDWAPRNSCIFLFGPGLSFLATKYLSLNICSTTDLEKNTLGKCKLKQKIMFLFRKWKPNINHDCTHLSI